jgi:hypothetical protein
MTVTVEATADNRCQKVRYGVQAGHMTTSTSRPARISTDFDFLVGTWDVEHHRLAAPLSGSTEWITNSNSQAAARTYLDGAVSVDEITFPDAGASGVSLRLYSSQTDEWSIRWVSSRDGLMGPPVVGRWAGEATDRHCRLVGDELPQGGRPTRMTYEWDVLTPTSARWQQAYSLDDERTWEKNWEMRFTRTSGEVVDVPQDHVAKVTSDFDFLTGTWRVRHRKLRSRLTGCTDWDEFESSFEARTHLHGLVSVDEGALTGIDGSPYRGMTFRTYDVAAGEWVLHWFDSRSLQMDESPVRGRFSDGVGEFLAEDHHGDIPIICRYRWTVHSDERAGWEQAFSTDDGVTWETNWVMEETRVG